MKLWEFFQEYDSLVPERKAKAWQTIFGEIAGSKDKIDEHEALLFSLLDELIAAEEEDYFGTEGLDV